MQRLQFAVFAVLVAVVALSSPAQAQVPTQLYASPTGSGSACSPSSPCGLIGALAQAGSGSSNIVSCINGGFYAGNFFVTNSVTLDCPGAILTSTTAPAFTFGGGNSEIVILRNLTFDGANQQTAPFIQVTGGATLIIENCKFQNIANNDAIAIRFLPSSPAAQLIIRDSVFANNGIAPGTGGGLQVSPSGSGSAAVVLERVSFNYNITSVVLNGAVNVTMNSSTVTASRANGILVGSGATIDINDSTLVYNVGSAVSVASGGTLRLSNTNIKNNQIGVSNSGGQALSYTNNRIVANGSSDTLTSIPGGQ